MTVNESIEFVKLLFASNGLSRNTGFPNGQLPNNAKSKIWRQIERYLTESELYRRCREVEWVDVTNEGESLCELQRIVRTRYAQTGITIEVNPVSNIIVGDISDRESHPLWRLAPGLSNNKNETLQICIGSDDPFPLSTTLPEEYQFLFDSLVVSGKSNAEARLWIDMVRKMGMESRFTVQQ